jgi:hypothetical protein
MAWQLAGLWHVCCGVEGERIYVRVEHSKRRLSMETDIADIQKGMEVYGTDGEKLGHITEVYGSYLSYSAATGGESSSLMTDSVTGDTLIAEARGEISGTGDMSALSEGYFKMVHGGILGIGATELYVPFGAVCDVAPGRCVTLTCEKEDCDNQFANLPASLQEARAR